MKKLIKVLFFSLFFIFPALSSANTGTIEFSNPFDDGFALFRPYNSYSWNDELYRVVDPTYYGRLGIDWGSTVYANPELSGNLLIWDIAPYLNASQYCEFNWHTFSLAHSLASEVDTWTNTVYYWYATDSWIQTGGGVTYEYIECYTEPTYTYEQAIVNLTYSQYVVQQHILYAFLLFFFLSILFAFFSNVLSWWIK